MTSLNGFHSNGNDQHNPSTTSRRIALVVPDLATTGGGVISMATFLYRVINASGRYQAEIISLAGTARDRASVRLLAPPTWTRQPQVLPETWRGIAYHHVGTFWPEIEAQRYRPRRPLDDLLRHYDLIQVVAGGPAPALAALRCGRPVCLYVATTMEGEGASLRSAARGWRKLYLQYRYRMYQNIEQDVLPRVAHVFAESNYTRKLLNGLVAPQQLSLGLPGVNTSLFAPPLFAANGSNPNGPIIWVGRFGDPRKNLSLLLHAYQQLSHVDMNSPDLLLVGNGAMTTAEQALIRSLGIESRVAVRQNLRPDELAALYRQAAFFVLSSDEEGLGIVVLEAMASGLPVVSTACGGPATAVLNGQTGFLTPVGDVGAFAQALQRLAADPHLRRRMGQAARERAEQLFSYEAAGRAFLDRYDEILSQ